MAKLKIGEGIRFEAHLPEIKELPALQTEMNVQDVIDKVVPLIPKAVDLSLIEETILSMDDEMVQLKDRIMTLHEHQFELWEQIEDLKNEPVPELKHITHIKDVSPEVLKECKEMVKSFEVNVLTQVESLQQKLQKEKRWNYILSGLILLTIFFHLK